MRYFKKGLAILLIYGLLLQASPRVVGAGRQKPGAPPSLPETVAAEAPLSLQKVMDLPSLDVAARAEKASYSRSAIQKEIHRLDQESKKRESTLKAATKQAEREVSAKEKWLAKVKTSTEDPSAIRQRKLIQCQTIEIEKRVTDQTFEYLQQQIAADVQISKLQLLEKWGAESRQVDGQIVRGATGQRPFGNVLDIGHRGSIAPFKDQEDDVSWGKKELEAARQNAQFPKEIESAAVTEYVNRIAQNLARNSDLHVPLHVIVVQQEVVKNGRPVLDKNGQPQQVSNAMALPGGYLIVYAGLIQAAGTESQLAGVISHEMAHIAARHGHRLAKKGTAFNIVSLAALIGLQLIAPGLFQAATYLGQYLKGMLLQAIFNGLGLVFTLDALGVSRGFELEADQLGMQYAWKTGYDPRGFIELFDRISVKEGYASRTSFFATHPAFGERILNSLKECKILESLKPNQRYLTDTLEFQRIQAEVNAGVHKTGEQIAEEENRPSLNPADPSDQECRDLLEPATPRDTKLPKPRAVTMVAR